MSLSSRANTSVLKDGDFNLEENKLREIQELKSGSLINSDNVFYRPNISVSLLKSYTLSRRRPILWPVGDRQKPIGHCCPTKNN